MITATQYTRTYEAHKRVLQDDARRIADSTEARAYLMKHLPDGDAEDLLNRAVECIADLTGDRTLLKALNRRLNKHDSLSTS